MTLNESDNAAFLDNLTDYSDYNHMLLDDPTDSVERTKFTAIELYVLASLYLLFSVLGVTFNLLTIFVLKFEKSVSEEVKVQLTSKAVSDGLSALCLPMLKMTRKLQLPFPNSVSVCRVVSYVGLSGAHASVIGNAAISLERFVVVLFPFRAMGYKRVHKCIVVSAVWFIACVLQVYSLIYGGISIGEGIYQCEVNAPMSISNHKAYAWVENLDYLISCTIITISYVSIFVHFHNKKKMLWNGRGLDSRNKQFRKVQRMLVADGLLTVSTVLPYTLYFSISRSLPVYFEQTFSPRQIRNMNLIFQTVMGTNRFSTPMVYFIFNRRFRLDTYALLKKACCRRCPTSVSDEPAV